MAALFSRTVWLGIIVNMLFVIACFFYPMQMCDLLHLKRPEPIIWLRTSGMLLFIISVFYLPATPDPFRGQEGGFLSIAVVDLFSRVVSAVFLCLAFQTKHASGICTLAH